MFKLIKQVSVRITSCWGVHLQRPPTLQAHNKIQQDPQLAKSWIFKHITLAGQGRRGNGGGRQHIIGGMPSSTSN
jgi:hypothetical protein